MFNERWCNGFVDIGGIDYHQCLDFLFIIYLLWFTVPDYPCGIFQLCSLTRTHLERNTSNISKNDKQTAKHLMFVKSQHKQNPKSSLFVQSIIVRFIDPNCLHTYERTVIYHKILVNQLLLCFLLYINSSLKFPCNYTLEKTAGKMKNEHSRETDNTGHTRHKTQDTRRSQTKQNTQHDMCWTPLYANKHK